MPTICIGKYSLEEAKQIRQAYRTEYGSDIRVRFRGRGRRRFYDNEGNWHNYSHSLPLRYAEKVAIYIDVDMNERRIAEATTGATRWIHDVWGSEIFHGNKKEKNKVIRKFGIATFMEKLNASV